MVSIPYVILGLGYGEIDLQMLDRQKILIPLKIRFVNVMLVH